MGFVIVTMLTSRIHPGWPLGAQGLLPPSFGALRKIQMPYITVPGTPGMGPPIQDLSIPVGCPDHHLQQLHPKPSFRAAKQSLYLRMHTKLWQTLV
jgi:hypothetical protein